MKTVQQRIEELKPEINNLVKDIHDNPELGHQEFKAVEMQTRLLEKYGFSVEKNTAGLATAFTAIYNGSKDGPTIGYLSEYDALEGMGHACGHNMIAGLACCSAIAMRQAAEQYGGRIMVIGAPAEETDGGKVHLAKAGIYDQLSVALMAHPWYKFALSGNMYALEPLQFEFFGKEAHAAAEPEKGVNALDGAMQTFAAINALREHLRDSVRIHGIIKDGGKAANIVPGYACAQFYVRAASSNYLKEVAEKIRHCALGAAECTGTAVKITNYETSYDSMMSNDTLSNRMAVHLNELGITGELKPEHTKGSSDIGAVSQRCPAIHGWFDITGDESIGTHMAGFADCTISDYGLKNMYIQAASLVMTGEDVLRDPSFLNAAVDEFERRKKEV